MADKKGIIKFQEFSGLKLNEKRAVMLRAEGKTYEQVMNNINDEFALDYSLKTIQEWFAAGGRLEQAYHDYVDALAYQSLKEARQLYMRSQRAASAKIISLMNTSDDRIALDAAKTIKNTFIPDKQLSVTPDNLDDDIPAELRKKGEEIFDAYNDARGSGGDSGSDGAGAGQGVAPDVLPEQGQPDQPGA